MENATPPPSTPPPSQPSPSATPNPDAARMWNMWCHLSTLAGLIVPFGNLIGPLVVWQMKRNEFPSVEEHGKESLNFQLSILIYLIGGGGAVFILSFFCIGLLLIPILIVIPLAGLILAIIAGLKANDGVMYRYPLTLRLIK
jgi:uncharacterized Tic20 family protein